MKKILIIERCNDCKHFNDNMYGTRCFHKKVVKPHEDGVIPKKIKWKNEDEYFNIPIPKWCPLDDAEEMDKQWLK